MGFNEKQLQIINTAEKLFSCKGFDGTTVRDIAEAAGVNVAMISYYFGSKEKLMQALFEERTSDITVRVESLLNDASLEPFQKINSLIEDYINRMFGKQQFYKLMVYEQMLEKNEMIAKLLDELKTRNGQIIEKMIKEGQKKGVFKKNVDISLMMNTMIGTGLQTVIHQDYYKNYNHLEALNVEDYHALLKKRLINHIRVLFKAILSYEV